MRFYNCLTLVAILVPVVTTFDLKCYSVTGNLTGFVTLNNYCHVSSLNITSPGETITSVNGASTPATNQGLHFYQNVVPYLPKGIAKFFPQLKELYVNSCGLKSIQAADLEGLSNLEVLYIYDNAIEELKSDLFKNTPKVNVVSFGSNQISRVGKDLFTNLHSFKGIIFEGNKCINSYTLSDFEEIKTELQTKCPYPDEIIGSEVSKPGENELVTF